MAEVAIAIYLAQLPDLTTAHFGVFWDRYLRDTYPHVSDQPAAPPVPIEAATGPGQPLGLPQIIFGSAPLGRHWYASADQTRLIQLQQDRLVVNWRKLGGETYPRFGELRTEIERVSDLWSRYLEQANMGTFAATQTEVTYINYVESIDVVAALHRDWPEPAGRPDGFKFEQRFTVPLADVHSGVGYLYLTFTPLPAAPQPLAALNLIFRGPGASTTEDALSLLDIGHNQIINTFRDVLTDRARTNWGEGLA